MPLKTTMQRRARQMRDRLLQRVETIIKRQQRVPPERDHHRLLIFGENS